MSSVLHPHSLNHCFVIMCECKFLWIYQNRRKLDCLHIRAIFGSQIQIKCHVPLRRDSQLLLYNLSRCWMLISEITGSCSSDRPETRKESCWMMEVLIEERKFLAVPDVHSMSGWRYRKHNFMCSFIEYGEFVLQMRFLSDRHYLLAHRVTKLSMQYPSRFFLISCFQAKKRRTSTNKFRCWLEN